MYGCHRAAGLGVLANLLWFAGTAARAETDAQITNSGINGPPYAEIYNGLARLAKAHPGWADVFDYGISTQGRPLRLIRIQNPTGAKISNTRPAVLISGATHGNEYLHIEDRLPAFFLNQLQPSPGVQQFLALGGVVYVVPIVNPDGYEARRRGNAHGTDLNRDYDLLPGKEAHFRESETRTLAKFLDKEFAARGVQLRLTVDYHCCDGSILFPWAYTDQPIPAADLAAHEQIAHMMQQDIDSTYTYGPTGPVLGYNPRGTSKDYYYARYGALAFTFEGRYQEESKKFQSHTVFWNHVLAQLAGGT